MLSKCSVYGMFAGLASGFSKRSCGFQAMGATEPIKKERCFFFNIESPTPEKFSKMHQKQELGGGNSNIFYFHPYLGKIPILTNIFQMD